jgi:hypothetical protein
VRAFVIVAGVVAFGSGCGVASGAPNRRVAPPRFVVDQVRAAIARSGDTHPVSARFVLTRREDANEVLDGDGVNSNQPVYAVVVKGWFKVTRPGPQKASGFMHVPVLFYVIDARTGRETDGGSRGALPRLSRLGATHDLLPYIRSR